MNMPLVFGLNYESSGFEVREKMAFSYEEIPHALNRLQNSGVTTEAIILSTCNRVEIYCVTHDVDFVINAICDMRNVCPRTVKKHSYIHTGIDCAKHLFRVASGLESMVLGETEIVAQVKDAFHLARKHKSIATNLAGLFQIALSVEKDVRNSTDINNISMSMGSAIVGIVTDSVANLTFKNILFLGAGEMMTKIAPYFKDIAAASKMVINRTVEKAKTLSLRTNAGYAGLEELSNIDNYHVIIACCAGGVPLLDEKILEQVIKNKNKMLIIDLSMPLTVSNSMLGKYENITILTIDDIAKIVDVGLDKRKDAASNAHNLINERVNEYQSWLKKRGLTPLIRALRDNADLARVDVLLKAQKQLQNGEDAEEVLKDFSIQLTNKLLHGPTVNLSRTENKLQDDLAWLVSYLYDLN